MKFKQFINEVSGYTMKAGDKKIIKAFVDGDTDGKGKVLWIEGDYLYGPMQSSKKAFVAKRDSSGKITTGMAYGNVSQTWLNFVNKLIQ